VVIGGQAGVLPGKIVRSGSVIWGTPSRPMGEFKKTIARLARLDALAEKVKALAKQIDERSN
jgi:UDP-3-O-[3-hydroxymyristoyl] glucosamine N-acyltransferase